MSVRPGWGFPAAAAILAITYHVLTVASPPGRREYPPTTSIAAPPVSSEPIQPLVAEANLDPARVALGRGLFSEKRISSSGTVACSSCHDLARAGVDHLPHSVGTGGRVGTLNAPTVYNSSLNFRQFWDGRAATLEEQIDGPIQNPAEMAMTWTGVVDRLNEIPRYHDAFEALYPDGVQAANVRNAIATFERSLVTTDSRFDRYLRGELEVLTGTEKAGYSLFKSYGCISCHQGANVGGNMFQVFGVMGNYLSDRGRVTEADQGRFNVTHHEADRLVFRVPSLRLAVETAPYFHDGSAKTLEDAIDVMARYQLGRTIPRNDRSLIIEFLKTLPGNRPEENLYAKR